MSPFILFSLSASAILPACLVLLALQDRIGRKAMASSSLVVSGLFTAGTGIVLAYQQSYPDPVLLAVLSIIGRFGVTVAYNSGAQYAAELIPTCVRGQGVAAAHVAGYALTFFSSYILYTVGWIYRGTRLKLNLTFLAVLSFRRPSSKPCHRWFSVCWASPVPFVVSSCPRRLIGKQFNCYPLRMIAEKWQTHLFYQKNASDPPRRWRFWPGRKVLPFCVLWQSFSEERNVVVLTYHEQ